MIEVETYPADSDTTNIMLRETRYFQVNENIMTIARSNAHIMGTGSAALVLP